MLSYNLTSYERAFTFRILSQDSAIKDAIASAGGSFVTRNGWTIQIARSPEIKVVSKRIYLRGSNKANDKRIDRTWNISSNFKLHQYINQIDQALGEIISFAENYKSGFRTWLNGALAYGYKDIHDMSQAYPFEYMTGGCLPFNSWAPEARIRNWYSPIEKPFQIDAHGWGNNKLKDIPTWESSK